MFLFILQFFLLYFRCWEWQRRLVLVLDMEGRFSKNGEACPHLLDLIPKEKEWLKMGDGERNRRSSEEKKLELRLGPPGGEDWSMKQAKISERSDLLSLGYFLPSINNTNNYNNNKNGFSFLQFPSTPTTSTVASQTPQSLPVMAKESSKPCCTKVVDLQSTPEKKAFSSPSPAKIPAVPTSSQKRYVSLFFHLYLSPSLFLF